MKKVEIVDWRVEVIPESKYYREPATRKDAEALLEQVKRHIDFHQAYVENSTEDTCSHCGDIWSEDNEWHNCGCCGEDMAPVLFIGGCLLLMGIPSELD
jgi:hypothetical protein